MVGLGVGGREGPLGAPGLKFTPAFSRKYITFAGIVIIFHFSHESQISGKEKLFGDSRKRESRNCIQGRQISSNNSFCSLSLQLEVNKKSIKSGESRLLFDLPAPASCHGWHHPKRKIVVVPTI